MITKTDLQGLLDDALVSEESDEEDFKPYVPAAQGQRPEAAKINVEDMDDFAEKKDTRAKQGPISEGLTDFGES